MRRAAVSKERGMNWRLFWKWVAWWCLVALWVYFVCEGTRLVW
jgi:hypothetical protein